MVVHSPTSRSGSRVYLSVWDLSWAAASPMVALYVRDPDIIFSAGWGYHADWTMLGLYWALTTGFAVLAFFAFRLQDGMTRHFSVHEAIDIAEAVLLAELMTFLALFTLTRLDGIPRSIPMTHGVLLLLGLIAIRMIMRVVFSVDGDIVPDHRVRRERIIIIGANRAASSFIRLLEVCAPQRQSVVAVLDDSADVSGKAISRVQVLGAPHELDAIVAEFRIHGVDVDRVVIAGEADFLKPPVLREVERVCDRWQIKLAFLPRMIGVTEPVPADVSAVVQPEPTLHTALRPYFRLKRVIDVIGALALITLLLPLFVITALLVLLDVGRPVWFWQERIGWKRRSFLIYKFRTLKAPFAGASDRQPSLIGRFLRATRLDELPQLFNVLLGDMSLIGPRPLLPEDQPANISVRASVRPGISGWAQVNGGKLVTKEQKEKLDEWYVDNASLGLDLRVALMTVVRLLNYRAGSEEAVADTAQVQSKSVSLQQTVSGPSLAVLESPPRTPRPVNADRRRRQRAS
jgi:lipopolysaccharide/colanic/teichoic acid biosynthesis glycosyltransferase